MAREAKVIIRLDEEVKERFQKMADDYGMTMSALGSFVIGKFMRDDLHQRELQEKMAMNISPQLLSSASDSFSKIFQEMQNRP